jgi:UDP-N-acetylmuramate--alanine ligase
MELRSLKNVYFLGIGGIGMSALARYFKQAGVEVSGYDKTRTTLTNDLELEGIAVHYEEDIQAIPDQTELVIYTPAIPASHKEWLYLIDSKIPMVKRSEVLGWLAKDLYCIAISGTHGKTSISCMAAHLLIHAGKPVNAFVGGISVNYQTNLMLAQNAHSVVVEADEYDRSFLQLSPNLAVISAIDADHLDIYKTHEILKETFIEFAGKIRSGGTLIRNVRIPWESIKGQKELTYGIEAGDYLSLIHISEPTRPY